MTGRVDPTVINDLQEIPSTGGGDGPPPPGKGYGGRSRSELNGATLDHWLIQAKREDWPPEVIRWIDDVHEVIDRQAEAVLATVDAMRSSIAAMEAVLLATAPNRDEPDVE